LALTKETAVEQPEQQATGWVVYRRPRGSFLYTFEPVPGMTSPDRRALEQQVLDMELRIAGAEMFEYRIVREGESPEALAPRPRYHTRQMFPGTGD
jgi:hypothetical protein